LTPEVFANPHLVMTFVLGDGKAKPVIKDLIEIPKKIVFSAQESRPQKMDGLDHPPLNKKAAAWGSFSLCRRHHHQEKSQIHKAG